MSKKVEDPLEEISPLAKAALKEALQTGQVKLPPAPGREGRVHILSGPEYIKLAQWVATPDKGSRKRPKGLPEPLENLLDPTE